MSGGRGTPRRLLRLLRARSRRDALWELRRRLRGRPPSLPEPVAEVLVVCHGNLCRSPFLEAWLRRRAPGLRVRSAGLAAADGDPACPVATRVARELGVELGAHRTRRLRAAEVEGADLILAMEGHQAVALARAHPRARGRVRLIGDYLERPPHRIPDPWGRPDETYREVFRRLTRAAEALLARSSSAGAPGAPGRSGSAR